MRPRTAEHGTRARYSRKSDPCRCEPCREANRAYVEARRRAAGVQPQKRGYTHGSSGYVHYGCRCLVCRAGHAEKMARAKARRLARVAAGFDPGNHGSAATYNNWGCRCEPCKAAHSERMRVFHERRKAS